MTETKFEKDLKTYFPDIYKIHQWGKFDRRVWMVFDSLLEMGEGNCFGEVTITYQNGKINHVFIKKNVVDNRG